MSDAAKAYAAEVYARYVSHYEGEIQGCCPVIASDILAGVGGVAVAGLLCFGGIERPHWWVEVDGATLDPMGDDLLSYEDFGERHEVHRDQDVFHAILPEYEKWRVPA